MIFVQENKKRKIAICAMFLLHRVNEKDQFVDLRYDFISWIDVRTHSFSSSNPQRLDFYFPVCHRAATIMHDEPPAGVKHT